MMSTASKKPQNLLLKWGTVKGWSGLDGKCLELLNKYFKDGEPMSCAMDNPDEERRLILCELIDSIDGTIHNDWEGADMTKDEAKKYIMEYGKDELKRTKG